MRSIDCAIDTKPVYSSADERKLEAFAAGFDKNAAGDVAGSDKP
ncbi:MAG: hypothetical protein NTZ09_16540 [Candidatus Hydrogenedentes bacterium]|nr:hypothetical protein [Candidatus Hydrogenedentota bacterium]